jgi:hypothetical protein
MRFTPLHSRLVWKLLAAQGQEQGSAMLIVSVVSVLMFSLLGATMLISDLSSKSSTAFADNSSSFYSAESGLNRRAEKLRRQFLGFAQPDGTAPSNIGDCINSTGVSGTGDFGCETDIFNSTEPRAIQRGDSIISTGTVQPYLAYTYIQPNPRNLATFPELKQIPSGELYAGLFAQEYNYRLYSTAIRRVNGADLNSRRDAQTVLQMDFNSRVIPLFQFGAFYQNDLEFNPSPPMSLNGRIHTNGNLYLRPDASLSLEGPVTTSNDLYTRVSFSSANPVGTTKFSQFDTTGQLTTPEVIRSDSAGTPLSLAASNDLSSPAVDQSLLTRFASLLRTQAPTLQIPPASFTTKVDASQSGGIGEYYGKADLQLEFLPGQLVPFELTAIKTGMSAGGCSGVTISTARLNGPWQCSVLTEGQRRSLQQPVMVYSANASQAAYFCPSMATPPNVAASRRLQVVRALQAAIVSQPTPVAYSALNNTISGALSTSFATYLGSIPEAPTLLARKPTEIAAIGGGCFLPPPIQAIQSNGFTDQREGRAINLLQLNVRSLTAWNYYNISVDWAGNTVTNHSGGQGNSTDELLFQRAPIDATIAAGTSFRSLAAGTKSFAAADSGEGGLVIHETIDRTANPYTPQQSPYGFAVANGANLPAPLTIVSDQAIYLQGDYNTIDKRPASIIGDTISVLSNACWDDDAGVTGPSSNKCGRPTFGDKGMATATTVNAAFLTNTMTTNAAGSSGGGFGPTPTTGSYSGGINNYMRFLENWQNIPFRYSGSIVSLYQPQEFNGTFQPGSTNNSAYFYPPIRIWSFDTSFNQFAGLPPLSPRVIYLQQQVFGRKY